MSESMTGSEFCGTCNDSYQYTFAEGATPEETLGNLFQAQDGARDAHGQWHQGNDVVHIRKQVNPRRIRTGNQFYKNRVQLSAAENGSQTLCGALAGTDMSWADTRHAGQLAYVTCDECKAIRARERQ